MQLKAPIKSDIEEWMNSMITRHAARFSGKELFIDVGGYQGGFSSILWDTGAFTRGMVFEPNPENVDAIRKRFESNPAITTVSAACSNEAGSTTMYCSGPSYTGSILPYKSTTSEVNSFEVPLQRLDDAVAESDHSKVGFIKIDTQGNDLRVLEGARRIIESSRPWLLTEMLYTDLYENQCQADQISSHLAGLGYVKASEFNEYYSAEGWLAWSDACFVPREHARETDAIYEKRPTLAELTRRVRKRPLRTVAKILSGNI